MLVRRDEHGGLAAERPRDLLDLGPGDLGQPDRLDEVGVALGAHPPGVEAAVAALEEEQRRDRTVHLHRLDLAQDDVVVAGRDDVMRAAVDVGDGVLEHGSAVRRGCPRDVVELPGAGHRHEAAQVELVVGQDVDAVCR